MRVKLDVNITNSVETVSSDNQAVKVEKRVETASLSILAHDTVLSLDPKRVTRGLTFSNLDRISLISSVALQHSKAIGAAAYVGGSHLHFDNKLTVLVPETTHSISTLEVPVVKEFAFVEEPNLNESIVLPEPVPQTVSENPYSTSPLVTPSREPNLEVPAAENLYSTSPLVTPSNVNEPASPNSAAYENPYSTSPLAALKAPTVESALIKNESELSVVGLPEAAPSA